MKKLEKTTLFAAAAVLLAPQEPERVVIPTVQPAETRAVDLAICLDTSGSMQGLIDSARQGIWAIVNDLALAQPTPKLRVALLTYGNNGHSPESGWVTGQLLPVNGGMCPV